MSFLEEVHGGHTKRYNGRPAVVELFSTWAYEEIPVTDGGTVTGRVTMTGGKPTAKGFNLVTFPDPVYCGRISTGTGWRVLHEFSVDEHAGLKDRGRVA